MGSSRGHESLPVELWIENDVGVIVKEEVKADSLLWVVGGVRKYPRVEPSLDPVGAFDYDPVLVCFKELVVEENAPDSVHKFSPTMRDDRRGGRLPEFLENFIADIVRKLQRQSV